METEIEVKSKMKDRQFDRLKNNKFVLVGRTLWFCPPSMFPYGEVLDEELLTSSGLLRMSFPEISFIDSLVIAVARGDHLEMAMEDDVLSSMFHSGRWV